MNAIPNQLLALLGLAMIGVIIVLIACMEEMEWISRDGPIKLRIERFLLSIWLFGGFAFVLYAIWESRKLLFG